MTRSSLPSVDLSTIYKHFQDGFKLFLDAEQVPIANRPKLVEEYPKDHAGEFDHSFEIITIKHLSSKLAPMNAEGTRIPQAPILRESVSHPDKTGYQLVTKGWWENTTLEFTVFSKSNLEANRVAILFHKFAILYGCVLRYFNSRNISNFAFMERGEDAKSKDYTAELYVRPLRYNMRLEYLFVSESRTLENLTVSTPSLA